MRRALHILWSAGVAGLLLFFTPGVALAQAVDVAEPADSFVVLDVDAVFVASQFGIEAEAKRQSARREQLSENAELILALNEEEQALTKQRKLMTREAFQPLAIEFDQKVRALRTAQDEKSQAIEQTYEDKRLLFFNLLPEILDKVLQERNAKAVLDRRVLLYARQIFDVTDDVVVAVDLAYAAGYFDRPTEPATPPSGE
ncbi:MAG: OmpH family outer membrane protein [Halocynthiibacter sp.]